MTTILHVLLFEGFEHLDADGPLTFLSRNSDVKITGANSHVQWVANESLATVVDQLQETKIDWLLVPGGVGTRALVKDATFCALLRWIVQHASLCMSVCTGSALLAAAGCLDGHKATSNKRSWAWASAQGSGRVLWQHQARWVESGKFWTSSGVAAGMDMALAFITEHAGDAVEYEGHYDSEWDPFAVLFKTDDALNK